MSSTISKTSSKGVVKASNAKIAAQRDEVISNHDEIAKTRYKSNKRMSSITLSSQAPTETSDEPENHINVVLRVRPLNSIETARKDQFACTFTGDGTVQVDNNGSVKQFGYNVVFEPDATQQDLFEHSGVINLINMAVNGYACTALAFGQTGSGKTHTMTGPPQQFQERNEDPEMYGIIQRSLTYLFKQLRKQKGTKIIRASYLEIYNEQVIDLLNPSMRRYLQVRWSKNKGFYVENLFVVECETEDDLKAVLDEGMRNKQTGSHGLNEFSSRSHSMLMLTIDSEMQDPEDGNLCITKRGKLTFVDLAGSEKVKDSQSTGDSLLESNSINKSLLVLGNCIASLGDQKRRLGHIPYRDSKLTKLLADSLGGNGVTLMICCITPSSYNASETMNTLRYASRAKKILTKPVVKMDPREQLILSLKKEIKVLRTENQYLRKQLEFPTKPRGQLQKTNDQKVIKTTETNGKPAINDTVKNNTKKKSKQKGGVTEESGLYEMLQEYMVENEALRTEVAEMQVIRDKISQEQQLLYRDNEKLMKRIDGLERRLNEAQTSWHSMAHQGSNQLKEHPPLRVSPRYIKDVASNGVTNGPTPARAVPQVDHPALRDHIHIGAQLQGYISPTNGNGRNKKPSPNRGAPVKPPYRLAESIPPQQPRPVNEHNGAYINGGPAATGAAGGAHYKTGSVGGPNRDLQNDSRTSVGSSSSDAVRDMNKKLKQELLQLDGKIQEQQVISYSRSQDTLR